MNTPTTPLTFTPGNFYRTRDGRKAEYVREMNTSQGILALVIIKDVDGIENAYTYHRHGRFFMGNQSERDLIAEWVDKPEVDWSVMPAWAVAVAMDANGTWYWYDYVPESDKTYWCLPRAVSLPRFTDEIPPAYAPKFTGDWRDSLVTREGTK